jgi:glycosyltransferase involved in cell wall biosynthesis
MNNAFFSVVIPNYNSKYLHRTLESLIKQTFPNWEAIVVDNNSAYNVHNIISNYNDDRLKFYKLENKGIIAKSRNYGILKSSSEYILFLDSDDWWKPQKLSILRDFVKLNKAEVIYHDMDVVYEEEKKIVKSKSKHYDNNFYLNILKFGNPIFNSSICITKKTLNMVKNLSEEIEKVSWEDFDLILRCAKLNCNILKINKNLGYYWIDKNNITNTSQTLKNINNIKKHYIENNKFFLNKQPWWLSSLLLKVNLKKKIYDKNIIILKKTVCYTFFDKLKWFYYLIKTKILKYIND